MPLSEQLEPDERKTLGWQIQETYGTPYKFIKATGIGKTTVYQVLAGTYPGDVQRQAKRIRVALAGKGDLAAEVKRAIVRVQCGRCVVKDTGFCRRCAGLFDELAAAVMDVFSQLG